MLELMKQERKGTYVEKLPEDVYNDVAEGTEFSPEDISKIGGVESQHGKFDKPLQGGSARGIFQFQPETAEHLIPGSSESLSDMNTQVELMKEYLNKNKQKSIEDAYMLHQLGPTRGRKFRDAPDEANIESVIPGNIIRANPSIYEGDSVEDAKDAIQKKLDEGKMLTKDPLAMVDDQDRSPSSERFNKLKQSMKGK
jgi:hypothetical protein